MTLSLIVPSAPDLNAFYATAQTIDSATKARRPKDKEKFDEAVATCARMLKGTMTFRSVSSLFHAQALGPDNKALGIQILGRQPATISPRRSSSLPPSAPTTAQAFAVPKLRLH